MKLRIVYALIVFSLSIISFVLGLYQGKLIAKNNAFLECQENIAKTKQEDDKICVDAIDVAVLFCEIQNQNKNTKPFNGGQSL